MGGFSMGYAIALQKRSRTIEEAKTRYHDSCDICCANPDCMWKRNSCDMCALREAHKDIISQLKEGVGNGTN